MENLTILLEKLAEKFGTTTESLWVVMVKQASVEIWVILISLVLSGILIFVWSKYLKYYLKNKDDMSCDKDIFNYILCIVSGIAVVIWFLISFGYLFYLPTLIFNPEYWALDKILSVINGGSQ